jgi:DNA-binding protein HU-alpha
MVTKAGVRGSASRTTTAGKRAAGAGPKPAPKPVAAAQGAPEPAQPGDLKRQELLAQVVARTEVKKKFAKPVLEAALAVIGEALAEGRDLNLAPLGKVRISRSRQLANGRVLVARIRQTAPRMTGADGADDKDAKEGVADPAE